MIHIGLDVGSTTVKAVVMDEKANIIYTNYERHFSDTRKTIYEALEKIVERFSNEEITIALTGSRSISSIRIFGNDIYSRGYIMQKSDRKIHT